MIQKITGDVNLQQFMTHQNLSTVSCNKGNVLYASFAFDELKGFATKKTPQHVVKQF